MAETIHLAIPADDKYWCYAVVTAASAERGSSLPIVVHIIDGGISVEHQECMRRMLKSEVRFHRVDVARWPDWHGSGITWSRLWLDELVPELDWIVSSDADIMFRGDIAELWAMRDNAYWARPSRDNPLPGHSYNEKAISWYKERELEFETPADYFCAGLTLFNLRALRAGGWREAREAFFTKFPDKQNMPNADQCALNYLLQRKIYHLPRQWGCFSGDENADIDWRKSGAVHFVEDMPWARRKCTQLMSDLVMEWWKVAESVKSQVSGFRFPVSGYRGCKNWFDYAWRRAAFVFLKHSQWILKLHPKLWLHLRSTRGIR